jgi:hypothetical protein
LVRRQGRDRATKASRLQGKGRLCRAGKRRLRKKR